MKRHMINFNYLVVFPQVWQRMRDRGGGVWGRRRRRVWLLSFFWNLRTGITNWMPWRAVLDVTTGFLKCRSSFICVLASSLDDGAIPFFSGTQSFRTKVFTMSYLAPAHGVPSQRFIYCFMGMFFGCRCAQEPARVVSFHLRRKVSAPQLSFCCVGVRRAATCGFRFRGR